MTDKVETLERSKLFLRGNREDAIDMGNGVNHLVLGYDDHILMAKAWFTKGAVGQLHKHHHSQVVYIAEGKFEVEVAGEKQILSAGECFFVPSNAMHGAVCLEAGLLIDVFSPVREDFINGEAYKS